MSWYGALIDLEPRIKRVVKCFTNAMAFFTYNDEERDEERTIVLDRNVLKNFEEQMDEIQEKVEQMKNGVLKTDYESYIGNKIFIHLDPRYKNVQFLKYDADDGIVEEHFIFELSDFERFLEKWNESRENLSLDSVKISCSPKHPCAEKTCYNCKL